MRNSEVRSAHHGMSESQRHRPAVSMRRKPMNQLGRRSPLCLPGTWTRAALEKATMMQLTFSMMPAFGMACLPMMNTRRRQRALRTRHLLLCMEHALTGSDRVHQHDRTCQRNHHRLIPKPIRCPPPTKTARACRRQPLAHSVFRDSVHLRSHPNGADGFLIEKKKRPAMPVLSRSRPCQPHASDDAAVKAEVMATVHSPWER